MTKQINVYDFIKEFEKMGRENQFTKDGLIALFDYLEMEEEEREEEIKTRCNCNML